MSADRQRLTSAIRRIAKTDPEIRGLLDAADNKGGKPGAAGVGGGLANSDGSNTSNETRICCDGSEGDANPGVEERDPDSGGQTGLDPSDPADIGDQGPGTLDGVTDCATGEPICLSGSGFIPPDGWDDPSSPPVVESYQDGFAWCTRRDRFNTCRSFADLPRASADAYAIWLNEQDNNISGAEVVDFYQVDIDYYYVNIRLFDNGFERFREHQTVRSDCNNLSAQAAEEGFACTEEPPLADSWPDDGCINLAIKGGKIVGSKYDPENDGSYSAPRDSIDLCDSEGNQISLAPSADGGWKTINSTTNNGYLYDSSGKQIAHIDGNEYSDPTI